MASFSSHSSFSSRGGGLNAGASIGGWGGSAGSSRTGMGLNVVAQRAGSVYGGAGGRGTRISTISSSSQAGGLLSSGAGGFGYGSAAGGLGSGAGGFGSASGAGFGFSSLSVDDGGASISANEKQTMQNLNDRLAKYLERVRTLEEANGKLEKQIREWGLSHRTVSTRDVATHQTTIDDLRTKILAAATVLVELNLQVDNTQLAADDFKTKYENELGVRQSVEADIAGLKRMLSELAMTKSDLEMQLEGVREEIDFLKKNHVEETKSFHAQLSGQVQVEVDAAPAADLNAVIGEIREQYEALVAKNRRDAESWFQSKAEVVQQEVKASTEVLQTSSAELKEGQSSMRNLELELQSLHSMKASLEGNLVDVEARYSAMLTGLQATVTGMESHLVQLRADTERSALEYKTLLDIKTRLEMEIGEYRRLLEGGDAGHSTVSTASVEVSGGTSTTTVTKKVVTVVQELVDGEVVKTKSATIKK